MSQISLRRPISTNTRVPRVGRACRVAVVTSASQQDTVTDRETPRAPEGRRRNSRSSTKSSLKTRPTNRPEGGNGSLGNLR